VSVERSAALGRTVCSGDCRGAAVGPLRLLRSIFGLSARNERAWRQRGQEPVCAICRRPKKPSRTCRVGLTMLTCLPIHGA
jgi:hypothetical protein